MKISEMILREDFYKINEETLASHYNDSQKKTKLYIYPRLNAIITNKPDKAVKKYLYTEYRIRNNILKRIAACVYLALALSSHGWFASRMISVNGAVNNDELIYPCNRKYRIFYFGKNEVKVMIKHGFPKSTIKKEMEFRQNSEADFILPILRCGEDFYIEQIIDGLPLARVNKGYKKYEQVALEKLRQFSLQYNKIVTAQEYLQELDQRITAEINKISLYLKEDQIVYISKIVQKITKNTSMNENLVLCFSHGDFQPGNIWIERSTEKLYIIDWENWGQRSSWYDEAVLKCNIRNGDGIKQLLESGYIDIFKTDKYELLKVVVAAEDLLYKLEEASGLPKEYGICQLLGYLKLNYGQMK